MAVPAKLEFFIDPSRCIGCHRRTGFALDPRVPPRRRATKFRQGIAMKIRWTKGSVRFRITPSELAAIERGASISETLALQGGAPDEIRAKVVDCGFSRFQASCDSF